MALASSPHQQFLPVVLTSGPPQQWSLTLVLASGPRHKELMQVQSLQALSLQAVLNSGPCKWSEQVVLASRPQKLSLQAVLVILES